MEDKRSGCLNYPSTVIPPTHTFTPTALALDIIRYIQNSSMLFHFSEQNILSRKHYQCLQVITARAGITNRKESESDSPSFRTGKKCSSGATKCFVY